MKKAKIIIFFILFFVPIVLFASEKQINMYLFYGDGCPHCAALEKYLNLYLKDKNNIKLRNLFCQAKNKDLEFRKTGDGSVSSLD